MLPVNILDSLESGYLFKSEKLIRCVLVEGCNFIFISFCINSSSMDRVPDGPGIIFMPLGHWVKSSRVRFSCEVNIISGPPLVRLRPQCRHLSVRAEDTDLIIAPELPPSIFVTS